MKPAIAQLKTLLSKLQAQWPTVRDRVRSLLAPLLNRFNQPSIEALPIDMSSEPSFDLGVAKTEEAASEPVYGAEFLADETTVATSTDFIYRKSSPVDLSGLLERPAPALLASPAAENAPPPVPNWEVQFGGETLGPFTRQEILDGLNDGAFPSDIKVRELPSQEWQSAETLLVVETSPSKNEAA